MQDQNAAEHAETGYVLHRVYVNEIAYSLFEPDEALEGVESTVNLKWDWRAVQGRIFEVLLGVRTGPTKVLPHKAEAVLVATFEVQGSTTTVTLEDFVRRNAIALLFPYVREAISSVSRRGPLSAIELPPLNVAAIAENFSFQQSTGARQLATDPELAQQLGVGMSS
jgi:preprotein translocase subunit SecB